MASNDYSSWGRAEFFRLLDRELAALSSKSDPELPPYPAVALRVQQAMGRPDFGLDEVTQLVGSDAALTVAVLRCANSPIYRRGAPATSLGQAIIRIGAHEVLRLLLASCLACHALTPGSLASLRRRVWLEGLAGAALCQELARNRGLKQADGFLVGLLHDFGKIVALAFIEKLLEQRPPGEVWSAQEWAALVERHHVALGFALASRWQLPAFVSETIATHHSSDAEPAAQEPGFLEVVRMSDHIVGYMTASPGVSSTDLTGVPGLGKFAEREAIVRVVQKIPEFIDAFEPSTPPRACPPSRIEEPQSTLAPGLRPVRWDVTVNLGHQGRQYRAHAIAANGIAMVGPEPLVGSRLHETTIHSRPGPLHIWSLAQLSRREKDSYHVELHPFALSGLERGLWDQLTSGTPPEK